MKKPINLLLLVLTSTIILFSCNQNPEETHPKLRPLADTVGFAQYSWQTDSVMARINRLYKDQLSAVPKFDVDAKTVISPHDDYTYVGWLYPAVLQNIKAKTIILIGVAHKARLLNLENQIIFDSYDYWRGPYGKIKPSFLREEIIGALPPGIYQVNDSMQRIEHSVEALLPFLQYYNHNLEIVSILVPYMSYDRMKEIAKPLADAINKVTRSRGWIWGKDYAIAISTDAVHYGDEDWGGKNFAYYGTDSAGYKQALAHEQEIISTLTGKLTPEKVKLFTKFTVEDNDYKTYKWTWCGRYSVPFGLLTSYYLNRLQENPPLTGHFIGYANSIDHLHLPVKDLNMGVTAPASMHHWVGYAGVVYY